MNQPLTAERVSPRLSLDDCLNTDVRWLKTDSPTALWSAQLGAETWAIRVNDFPQDHLYTLLINDEEVGNFDEWPRVWSRTEGVSNP
jgi:hypothetical protein